MARGVNKVILVGNLGNDPDIRYTQNQKQVANLSVATSDQWTDKATGQRQERTEWHKVVMFDRLAEIAGQYLKKGSKVYIEGKLQTRKWQNQQGQDQYTTEIVANEMQMLDGRDGGGQQQGGYGNAGRQAAPQQDYQQGYAQQPYAQAAPQAAPAQPSYQQPPMPAAQPQHAPQPVPQAAPQPMQQPASQPMAPPMQQPAHQQPAAQPAGGQNFNDFDDDIPF